MIHTKRIVGIVIGPTLFALVILSPIELDFLQKSVLGIALWMASWWISEAFPLHVTSLIPLALFPIFGIESIDQVFISYIDKIVLLFLGGFLLAKAMEIEKTYDESRLPGLMFCPYKSSDLMKSDITDMIELFLMHDRIFLVKDDNVYKLHITKESIHKIFLN